MEIKLGDADLRAAPSDEFVLEELFESDDLLSAREARALLFDLFFGFFRLISYGLMVTVPVLSAVLGWYAGRDELKPLVCTVIAMPDCSLTQPVPPKVVTIEANRFEPPMQRYSLPKFVGDDSPAKLSAPVGVQRPAKKQR